MSYTVSEGFLEKMKKRQNEKEEREKKEKEIADRAKAIQEAKQKKLQEEIDRINGKETSNEKAFEEKFGYAPIDTKGSMTYAITPTPEEDEGFFKAGAFDDGYQFGDVTKTVIGTAGDFLGNAAKGFWNMFEGVADTILYGASGVANLVGAEDAANYLKNEANFNTVEKGFAPYLNDVDEYSVLGNTLDSVAQGVGNSTAMMLPGGVTQSLGLGTKAAGLATTGMTFVSGFGSGMSEAYNSGATDIEAVVFSILNGAVEAGTEALFGGIGKAVNAIGISKGVGGFDDQIANALTKKLTNQTVKSLAKFGIKSAGEGVEEVLAGIGTAVAKKLSYMSEEDLGKLIEDENLMESFVVGLLSSAISQSPDVVNSVKTGRDFVTNYTQDEQKVIDKEIENRIAKAEEGGKKLNNKDKSAIKEKVIEDLNRGYISIDTIEDVLGDKSEYDSVKSEYDEYTRLYETESGKLSKKDQDRLAELEAKNKATPYETLLKNAKDKMSQGVFDLSKDGYLAESYREQARKGEDFQYDLSKYSKSKYQDAVKQTFENAVKAKANNTNAVHDLVDMNAKIAGETGIVFEYQTGEQIKNAFVERQTAKIQEIESIPEAQRTQEQSKLLADLKDTLAKVESGEITVNGDITADRIVLNLDSPNPLNRTVGHEITHSFEPSKGETSKQYTALRDALFAYAKTKGVDIDGKLAELKIKYQGIANANPEAELVADLVGDYLFTDNDFINNLSTKHRNIAQKIYDKIKHLLKLTTAGSKEARELEKVKKAFEDAFRKSGEAKGDAKYSISTETDTAYMDAVNRGDTETAQRMVDEAAEKWSKGHEVYTTDPETGEVLLKFYRSADGGRTVWNGHGNNQNQGVFLTSDPYIADAFDASLGIPNGQKSGQHITVYAKAENPFVIDAKGRGYTSIPIEEDSVPNWLYEASASDVEWSDDANDYVTVDYIDIDNLFPAAFKQGHDAVIVNNVVEGVGGGLATDVVLKDGGKQMKSADPVTYDDQGNVIPLSERFNTENDDIRYSLSARGEQFVQSPNNFYGKDFRVQNRMDDIAPVAEESAVTEEFSVAPVVSEAETTAEELFPDDLSPIQTELDSLLREKESLESRMLDALQQEDLDAFYQINSKYEPVVARINELEAEVAEADSDRFNSLDDADAPPEVVREYDQQADVIPLTKKLAADIARDVRSKLGLSNKHMADVLKIIAEYSKGEFPNREQLFRSLKEKFSTYSESYSDELVQEAKSYLRTYGIKVSDSIKKEIADYADLMRRNRGRILFSNKGTDVDVLYHEMNILYPHLFPDDVLSPTDQFLQIVDVANMDSVTNIEQEYGDEFIMEVADSIMQSVADYRQIQREKTANRYGRESFSDLMKSPDQYMPPVKIRHMPPTRTALNAQTEDIAPVFDTSSGQQAFMPEAEAPKTVTRGELHENIVDNIKGTFYEKGYDFDEVLKNAKDLSTFATVDNTPQRVMEKALGYKQGQVLADLTVNKVAQNETEGIKWLNSFTDRKNGLLAQISKRYNIKPGSKASAAAQMYAEGFYVGENGEIIAYGDAELAKDFPDANVQRNIKGLARDPRIRQIYDETLAAINESRARNAYPEIPRLDNYFLHFRAMDDTFSRLGLPFNPNDIRAKDLPTDLNGVTADLKPGQPYFASAMHRKGKRTSFDLLGGLEKYLTSAKNQIYHIDDIQNLRALRNYIADNYGQANGLDGLDALSEEEAQEKIEKVFNSHLSTFAKFLNEEANVLAGKTTLIDRGLEGVIGRRGITFLDSVNRQVGANMVGYNVSSSLTNFLASVQGFAKSNKADFIKGFAQFSANKVKGIFGKNDGFADNSPVMIRRKGAERFHRTAWQKVSDPGYALMGAVDSISTELLARAKYNEFTRKGMDSQQAHIETDKWLSRLMGDRSLGQQPQLYNSKMLGLFTKFQLEVRNQLDSQFYDTIQEAKVSSEDIENGLARNAKKAAKITSAFFQLAVGQHLFGKAFESIAGYNPAFDIISVLLTAFGFDDDEDSEDTALDNIEQAFLELLEDLPYTSTLTGGRIPISSALPVAELIKGVDQYGNEKSRLETFAELAPYYLMPGGYGQAKKTIQGLGMFSDEHPIAGSYTDNGDLRFPVEDTPWNRIQAGLFGQWASGNASDYFDNERKPLNEKQIQEFMDVGLSIQDYWDYRDGLSGLNTLDEKADYINSLNLTTEQKNVLINNLADREEDIDMSDYGSYGSFEEFDFATKNPEKYSFFEENGISYSDYASADEDGKRAYTWAYENPGKYKMSQVVTSDFMEYYSYKSDLSDIKADKDADGKTISGSAKDKKIEYINGLDLEYGQKIILFKSIYEADDTYNYEIVEYLNGRSDISYEEEVEILRELGFTVSSAGSVTW